MFATTSALRQASRRIASTSIRTASSASKASRNANEESLRKAMPLLFAVGGVAIGATQWSKVCVAYMRSMYVR